MVHVLQLESGNAISWHHVGGSGDGGVDGIGMSAKGEVAGVLQCKWYYSGNLHDLVRDGQRVRERWPNAKVVVAVLLGPEKKPDRMEEGVEILLLEDVATLVRKHRKRLPIAQSLGISDSDV